MNDNIIVLHHRLQELTAELASLRREKQALVEALKLWVNADAGCPCEFCGRSRAVLRSTTEQEDEPT